jgi:hypothetical protein
MSGNYPRNDENKDSGVQPPVSEAERKWNELTSENTSVMRAHFALIDRVPAVYLACISLKRIDGF